MNLIDNNKGYKSGLSGVITARLGYIKLAGQQQATLKSTVQVGDPSHAMCRKIMWELNFHNNMLI